MATKAGLTVVCYHVKLGQVFANTSAKPTPHHLWLCISLFGLLLVVVGLVRVTGDIYRKLLQEKHVHVSVQNSIFLKYD